VDFVIQLHIQVSFYFIFLDNMVYSLGQNEYGELGLGDTLNRTLPTEIKFFENKKINSIICGGLSTIVISNYFN
jgi:alpha-tubulin suppressor-like RCC1 family protein